jgi:hypothetical protein
MSESICRNGRRRAPCTAGGRKRSGSVAGPVVISDPLKGLPNLASDAQVPVVPMIPEADVLDGIPEILTEGGVPEKAPGLVRRR